MVHRDRAARGVPLRIEVGPKDVEKGTVVFARRDLPGQEGKSFVPQAGIGEAARSMLATIQSDLLKRAIEFRDANTHEPKSYDEFKSIVEDGFARAWGAAIGSARRRSKEETKATTRCIPLEQPGGSGVCAHCGKPAQEVAIFARAY